LKFYALRDVRQEVVVRACSVLSTDVKFMISKTLLLVRSASSPANIEVLIEPPRRWVSADWKSLWQHRELLYMLTWRDIKVRYKQTVLGAMWAVLQPLSTMVVFSIFFGRMAGMKSDGIPYYIFTFAALLPWMFFANGLISASNSLIGNANLINKVYFPRLLIPVAAILSGLVDFILSFLVLLGMMAWEGIVPSAAVLLLPGPLLLALVTALGAGLWLSALNVQFRDVRFTVPFMTQLWMFISPIAYPASMFKGPWEILYGLNPMTGVIEWFRWALCNTATTTPPLMIVLSSLVSATMLVTGALYFRRMERTFADMV
jgi:lipopolysaccharide transport system permease protein